MLRFVLFQANWGLVAINRKLFFVGSYPAEDTLRIWISLFIVVILVALTYGVWIGRLRPYIVAIGVVAVIILTLGLGTDLQIQEGQYTQEIQSEGQTAIVSGVHRELVWERGWGTPLALLALTGTRNPVRYILAATRWALCGPDRRSLGGQAPLQMEKQSDTASGDRRSVGPAHPDDRLAPVGGV